LKQVKTLLETEHVDELYDYIYNYTSLHSTPDRRTLIGKSSEHDMMEQNFGVLQNSSTLGAIVERIINSLDAILAREILQDDEFQKVNEKCNNYFDYFQHYYETNDLYKMAEEKINTDEAREQVVLLAKRTAMLYQAFAETLKEELGDEESEKLVLKSIDKFGTMCGQRIAEGVEELGLDLSISNYFKIPDLPKLGWEIESDMIEKDVKLRADVHYCPLADHWLEDMDLQLARLYCYVDQAKFSAYNPKIK